MTQQLICKKVGINGSKYRGFLFLIVLGAAVYYFLPHGFTITWPMQNNLPVRGYLVSSPHCQIPDINPYHPSILEHFHPEIGPIDCGDRLPLTYTERHKNRVHLRIAKNLTRFNSYDFTCCYSVVVRQTDSTNKLSACVKFDDGAVLAPDVQHLSVVCKYQNAFVYKNVHPIVQDRGGRPLSKQPISVVLVGVDSMSRLSLIRNMPLTVELLRGLGWVEMTGYNKVADNTMPNVMAFLSGLNESQALGINCLLPASYQGRFDHCPFIWKDFKRRGYTTAYAEDETTLSTFNYEALGFHRQPTDFYLQPSMVEAHEKLKLLKIFSHTVCLGETRTTDVVLNYTLDLLETYPVDLFAYVWLNNFSHEDGNLPAAADVTLAEFFRKVATMPAYESTIFVFLSDHGIRFGQIRQTNVGWFEERLPFLYIGVPMHFRERHPKAFENLVDNGGRLTSPFDLHLTLKDIIDGDNGRRSEGSKGCPTCVSLFDKVPDDRSCGEAGIPTHYCTCLTDTEVKTTSRHVREAVDTAVEYINAMLQQANIEARKKAAEAGNSSASKTLKIGAQAEPNTVDTKGNNGVYAHEVSEGNARNNSQAKVSNITKAKTERTVAVGNSKLIGNIRTEGKVFAKEIVSGSKDKARRTSRCAKLQVLKVVRARLVDKAEVGVDHSSDFRVTFKVAPGGAVLDATVRCWEESEAYETLGMVSRINAMHGEACEWVTDKQLRLYCYCVDGVYD